MDWTDSSSKAARWAASSRQDFLKGGCEIATSVENTQNLNLVFADAE